MTGAAEDEYFWGIIMSYDFISLDHHEQRQERSAASAGVYYAVRHVSGTT
jgi:hypothetical protein